MGSLMSGWSSSVLSDKEVRLMRNRSMTMEDVEAFWRQHGGRPPPAEDGEAARQLKVMRSMPPLRGGVRSDDVCSPLALATTTTTRGRGKAGLFVFPDAAAAAADTSSTTRGWWTRSSWAFLNDPPKEEVLLAGRAPIDDTGRETASTGANTLNPNR